MLEGLGEGPIIAGAYSVGAAQCPGLAAYRRGARTGYSEFAKEWDRYARGRGVRPARRDDIATLVAMLKASLAAAGEPDVLAMPTSNGRAALNGAATNGSAATNGAAHGNGTSGTNGGTTNGTNGSVAHPPRERIHT
jgi:hypothetical protein